MTSFILSCVLQELVDLVAASQLGSTVGSEICDIIAEFVADDKVQYAFLLERPINLVSERVLSRLRTLIAIGESV